MPIDSKNRTLVYDVESNGLKDTVTKLWCILAVDYETDEVFLFTDYPQFCNKWVVDEVGEKHFIPKRTGTTKEGAQFLSKAKMLIAHNCMSYDQQVLLKFFPKFKVRYDYGVDVVDTLLMSQVQFYKRPSVKGYKGVHNLAVWGARLGHRKPEIESWDTMDSLKLNRCIQDVVINKLVYDALLKEQQQVAERCNGLDFTQALKTEHEYAWWISEQERWGAKADVPHMERCIVELDKTLGELKELVEPYLPPVVKKKGINITYEETCKLLGVGELFDTPRDVRLSTKKKIIEFRRNPSQWRDKPNITESVPNKPFVKPVVSYTKVEKKNMYTAVSSEGIPQGGFEKLKDAREWVKSNHPDSKGWKYPKEEIVREVLNHHTCNHFNCEPEDIDKFGGPFSKVEFIESNMNQGAVVKKYLLSLGWVPTEWTYKKDTKGNNILDSKTWEPIHNSPKLTEDSYDSLPEGIGQSIAKYNTLKHRRTYIKNDGDPRKGVLNNVRPDGRVTCGVMTFGTVSGRASHSNIVNLPSVNATYGHEMRSIIVAEEGYTLCGVDMANAHPRILSFLTQNQTFLDAVRTGKEAELDGTFVGTDFHTVNAILFGLITEEDRDKAVRTQDPDDIFKVTDARKRGKGLSFLCLYGGSAKKLAGIIGVSKEEAQKRIDSFFQGLGLDTMLEDLDEQWDKQGRMKGAYISVYGGYHIWCGSKHKLINTMAIGSEAALQKYSVCWVMREVTKLGLDVKLILNMHDEVLFEVKDEDKEAFTPIAERFYEEGALNMEIDNDFMSVALWGNSYATVH